MDNLSTVIQSKVKKKWRVSMERGIWYYNLPSEGTNMRQLPLINGFESLLMVNP